ncbi:MAG TPA: histidine phosphatase family protein [Burkholderiales bacterium]|nr:histidine phosphatase family protein [Burkholderiales bacterium]
MAVPTPTGPAAVLRAFVFLVLASTCALAHADEVLWAQLREGGLVVFIRHAETDPGVGDPPGFRLDDCKTQRNLSSTGREQAKRLGAAFRRERVPVAQVLSSEWCRCRDTATLAFDRYEAWGALNNLFGRHESEPAQRRAMLERVSVYRGKGNLVLVTHGATILPVAGVNPAQGEMVVVRPVAPGKVEVVGRLRVD